MQEFTVPTQDQGKELVAAREFSFYHPGLHKPVQMAKVFCFLKQNANATWQSKMDCTKWTLSLHMIIPIKLLQSVNVETQLLIGKFCCQWLKKDEQTTCNGTCNQATQNIHNVNYLTLLNVLYSFSVSLRNLKCCSRGE